MNSKEQIMRTRRVLFVRDGCPHCLIFKWFVEGYNFKTKIEKRIKVVDMTKFETFGLKTDPLIDVYQKYVQGRYPFLFWGMGMNAQPKLFTGANSREEVESFLKVMLQKDFLIPEINPLMFNKDCEFRSTKFGKRKVFCE